MKNHMKQIRERAKAAAEANVASVMAKYAKEDHDVNISVKQDNDQGEQETEVDAPGDGTEPEVKLDLADKQEDKEQEIEQAITDAQQAQSIDDIATAVDTLESAKVIVQKLKATPGIPNATAMEALQLCINTALGRTTRALSVPSTENLVLDRNHELNGLERQLETSMEGLVDDVKIWVNKQFDSLGTKFNNSKLYDQLIADVEKSMARADAFTDAAIEDATRYKVPVGSDTLSYLAHAETAANIPSVWEDYCTGLSNALSGRMANLEKAMAANIASIMKGNKTNDEIAKDFFKNLNSIIHIDGSYIGYGWRNTVGNKVRKLFGRHMKWEPATFTDEKYAKVTAVWCMHPKDIEKGGEQFIDLLKTVQKFENEAPQRREMLRKSIVNTLETAAKAAEDKARSVAITRAKSLYMIVVETEKEIDKYLHYTMSHMAEYLRHSSQLLTIASNEE